MSDVSSIVPLVGTIIKIPSGHKFQFSETTPYIRIRLNPDLDLWEVSEENLGFMVFIDSENYTSKGIKYLRVARIASSGKAAYGELVDI